MQKHYGNFKQTEIENPIDVFVEEINVKGFTIVDNVFDEETLNSIRNKIDSIYQIQEGKFSRASFEKMQELDMCRAPLLYDNFFIKIAMNATITSIVEKILGEWFILNLQNAIINKPNKEHHQTSWHRDLPYLERISNQPLAINALIAVEDFSTLTGGTHVLPFSHKNIAIPSNIYIKKHEMVAEAKAGSVIMFDSMLFHRAGHNSSPNIRRAINNMYTIPLVKQQYDFSKSVDEKSLNEEELRLLGFTSQVPENDVVWRNQRLKKFTS